MQQAGPDRRGTATVPGWLARWRPDPQSAREAAGSRSPAVRVWSARTMGVHLLCIDGMVGGGGGRLRAPMGAEMEGIGKACEGARRA